MRGPDGEVGLRPKSFEVLRYLVEHAGEVVSKDDLINAVWPDVTVTDESVTRYISDVRHALNDADQHIIKTLPRRGYLLDLPVAAEPQNSVQAATRVFQRPLDVPRLLPAASDFKGREVSGESVPL